MFLIKKTIDEGQTLEIIESNELYIMYVYLHKVGDNRIDFSLQIS